MILIEKGDKTPVPRHFHLANNVCAYLYDQLTEILVDPLYMSLQATNINFEGDEELKQAFEAEQEHAFDILNRLGRHQDLEVIISKHLFLSILSDMVNFIYESMVIAKKGKISVAYALLRKPFTDQLLLLEQILSDRKDFIDRYFHDGDPQNYDPSSKKIDKAAIIEVCVQKLNSLFMTSDVIHALRYDKSCEAGINAKTNRALHIVTNDKSYRTEKQGLNFTFPIAPEQLELHYTHYYFAVSILLNYTAAIADQIAFSFIENSQGRMQHKLLRRVMAASMLLDEKKDGFSKGLYFALSKILVTECSICKHVNKFTKRNFIDYFFNLHFTCKRCFNPLELSDEGLGHIRDFLQRPQIEE